MKKIFLIILNVITVCLTAQNTNDIYGASNNTSTTNYNRQFLKEFDASISKVITTGTTQCNVLVVGDSWASQSKIHQPIATFLRNRFGDAGVGYCGTNSLTSSSGFNQVGNFAATRIITGSWTNISKKAWILSANISADSSSTINDSITFTGWVTNPVIHYMQKIGGGDFIYRIDGMNPITVSTSGTNSLVILPTSTVTDGYHIFSIKVSSTGTTGVTICGVELNRNKSGVRIHNLGVGGSKASDWVLCDSVTFNRSVSTFSPSMVIVSLGVNDCRSNVKPETVIGNLKRIVNRVVSANPNASICIFTQSDIGDITTYPMSYYINQMRTYALSNNYSFIDNYTLLGAYNTATVIGTYQDEQHVNEIGGNIFKNNFLNYLVPFNSENNDVVFVNDFYHSTIVSSISNATYHFNQSFVGVSSASSGTGKTYLDWNCTLTGFDLNSYVAGTLASNTNISYYIRVNNSYDVLLTSVGKLNNTQQTITASNLSVNLNAGDYIEIKVIVPTLSPAAGSVSEQVKLKFKRR